ncbi:uncharacterized protein L969DRAFT_94293 [Mixia osmundae IAM 14324]|uniref:Uncharacterized protein n=1 Tax=Mixia osmundae (strain CBS 9802 / IAM 14324 / JCM 22182 / KY 12970) TaxID=764103 RepID=G7E8F3_MIXOS|nr:uncharacterized protein L969DRAFT_94293 [Mixia osmundae IAM 14324]KEI39215.1 hypothetical protein L969DRAFT_94293 [Mixia osmundae IAM 14324]GAA99113.1 hypothetical protein E5Q_05802 [Mixia osmundae IAM 14324]
MSGISCAVSGLCADEADLGLRQYYDCCRAVLIVRFDAHYSEDTIENLTASLENYCAPDPRAEKPKCDDPRGWPGHTACNILSSTLTVDGNRYTPTVVPAAP